MTYIYSFPNEVRDIYRQTRQQLKSEVERGRIKPEEIEAHFKQRVSRQLERMGRPIPKAWEQPSVQRAPQPSRTVSRSVSTSSSQISSGVKTGVIAGGAFSITRNIHHVYKGNKTTGTAVKDVAIDVATAGVSSAGIAITAEGVKIAAKTIAPNMAKSLIKGSAPVVMATGMAELVVDAYNGQLTPQSATITIARTAGGWAGAEAGAAGGLAAGTFLAPVTGGISIPVLTILGGIVGGIGGSFGAGKCAELSFS